MADSYFYCLISLVLLLYGLTTASAKCQGRTVLTSLQGTISDGPSKYPADSQCEWLIRAPYPNVTVTLTFISYETECSYDYLFIYDGDSYLSPRIASISGDTLPQKVVAHSGQMLINLFSDINYTLQGFTANYTIANCTENCSGHGTCDQGFCQCDQERYGQACELESCPGSCNTAEGHGVCDYGATPRHCKCNHGYIGESCSLNTLSNQDSNKWYNISSASSVFSPRMAHSVVYIDETDTLLAFGGYSLSMVFDDLLQFNFVTSQWIKLDAGSPKPVGRHSHTASKYHNCMLLFGGELQSSNLTNDLWLFNTTLNTWSELATSSSFKPPSLAGHTATIVGDKLYIFGGRTNLDTFSSAMYSYSLLDQSGWVKISYSSGNELHLRMLGHTALYYEDMRSLVVFGGFSPVSPNKSIRTNRILAFHVELRVWSELSAAEDPAAIPSALSFHSAVKAGDYMVIYGGNVHEHHKNETCYGNKLFFYHTKCHKWISQSTFSSLNLPNPSTNPRQGRLSHHAVLRNGTTMLVVGGFSGLPLGDVYGYKLPEAVAEKTPRSGHCGSYRSQTSCKLDPECGWCSVLGNCFSLDQSGNCSASLVTGTCPSCAVYVQCSACLSWGSTKCGWCVQDSRCYPVTSPTGACRNVTDSNRNESRGWWGTAGQFLTSGNQCQTEDFPPGITVLSRNSIPNNSRPDGVEIIVSSELRIWIPGTTELLGFIYPFKYQPPPSSSLILMLQISTVGSDFNTGKLWLSTDETAANLEEVGSCPHSQSCSLMAQRSGGGDIFPSPSEDKRYLVKAEVTKFQTGSSSRPTTLSLEWNGTISDFLTEPFSGHFIQPFSGTDCVLHETCLACLSDAACGWCGTSSSCVSRQTSPGSCRDTDGNQRHLVLNATDCTTCADHIDCVSCAQDLNCDWSTGSTTVCIRKGQQANNVIKDAQNCSSPCSSRRTCSSCAHASGGCSWCERTQACISFGAYLSNYIYPYGQCSYWIDSRKGSLNCLHCSQHTSCGSCLADIRCGWCANDYDPRIGSCFEGDFKAPYSGQCSNIFPTNGSTVWSYAACPDIDECKLGLAQCHSNASCVNVPGSFSCICDRGFTGDGVTACDKTCYYDCGSHGECGADFNCQCDIGWLGDNCTTDCGCHGHSWCSQGIGTCDECQDFTEGSHCEFCVTGSYGNATTPTGCHECQCNGHGDSSRGLCNATTGKCYCTDDTTGDHCDQCMLGLKGDAKNGGLCFHECLPRSILTNVTQGFISTSLGAGVTNKAQASCVWLISSSSNDSHSVVYGPSPPPADTRGRITLTFIDMSIDCLTDHVDVYDGLPPFTLGQPSMGQSFYKLGSFCGKESSEAKSVTAMLGNMLVIIQADFNRDSSFKGFSAKFAVNKCPELCHGNRECVVTSHGEQCVCSQGWSGGDCDRPVCPNNCSSLQGRGLCNLTLGRCVCSSSFTGPDCSQPVVPGSFLWEVLSDVPHSNISTTTLARMGHSMISHPDFLLIFAGFSFTYGLLRDLQRFDLMSNTWSLIDTNQAESSLPSARYLHSAVLHVNTMLVYGGLTVNGTDDSLWRLNLTSLQWSKLVSQGPKVAGHTATLAGDSMVIIGGYDPDVGFNEATFHYDAVNNAWSRPQYGGPSPKGLYGHTAVFYAAKNVMLVFGGYRFRIHSVKPSDALYSLDLTSKQWHILQALPFNEPQPKYFHSAAILDDRMVVYGGRSNTTDQYFSRQLLVYDIKCNSWFLPSDKSIVGSIPEGLLSAAAVTVMDQVYLFGGFNGQTQATMSRLTLPAELCQTITNKNSCTAVKGCSWCEVFNVTQQANVSVPTNQSACYSVTSPVPAVCHAQPNVTKVVFDNGTGCSTPVFRACDTFYSCSACLASFPHSSQPTCHWCVQCSTGGKCIEAIQSCSQVHPCANETQFKLNDPNTCVENTCESSSCSGCVADRDCVWTPQLRWSTEIIRHITAYTNWNCFRANPIENVTSVTERSPPDPCPQPCTTNTECGSCLRSTGGDGGWQECVWSETLGRCFSPSFLPMMCLSGRCGRIVRGSSSGCMGSCTSSSQQCSSCLKSYNCGWCAKQGISGEGLCLEGGVQGPLHGTCQRNSIDPGSHFNKTLHITTDMSPVWAITLCPLENECLNGKHNCEESAQQCVDTPDGFKCECKPGYSMDQSGSCKPVCSQGCSHGSCVSPNVCVCDFGWTSFNCSVKCQCNEHGQCVNETLTDVCQDCRNHTVGQRCEFCEPLYVGDPRNNGTCVSCYNECNHSAQVCMNSTDLDYARAHNLSLDPSQVKIWLTRGPYRIDKEEECLCQNNSRGVKCKSCLPGFFFLVDYCKRCLCNGHGDSCNEKGSCTCHNNTMEDCASSLDCYKNQCAKCKENFMGHPVSQQQCYRKVSVMQEFVVGGKAALTNDKDIEPLAHGQAIFYAIYPKFTNVDIRMTIDVFRGAVDVFVTNEDDEFTVISNHTTGQHQVIVKALSGSRRRRTIRSLTSDNADAVDEVTAGGSRLNTFTSFNEDHRALIVRDVKNRLILTFPHSSHELRETRFYLVFLGRGVGSEGSTGLVYFRQDLSQIDLFVFFSVFFSVFFLVVSVCVMVWKVKQYHDRRRVVQVQVQQLEVMRSRPFATYRFLCEIDKPQASCWRVKRDTAAQVLHDPSRAKQHHLRLRDVRERPVVSPVSFEPSFDGKASVTSVVFQLPANECSDFQLLLGSALTLNNSQHSLASHHHAHDSHKSSTRHTVTFAS